MFKFLHWLTLVSALVFALPLSAQSTRLAAIQDHVGVSAWDHVHRVKFTWTLPSYNLARTYDWDVKARTVKVTVGDDVRTISALGIGLKDPADVEAHKAFINDSYWLLFEFHTAWDKVETADVLAVEGIPKGEVGVSVQYASGGYTPGDRYVLYATPEGRVTHWQYFPRGDDTAKFLMTREGWKEFGKIRVPTLFKNGSETFIEIKDVSIQ